MKATASRSARPSRPGDDLLRTWQARFEQNPHRHPGLAWEQVQARLESHRGKLPTLREMERTGGEPDVIGLDQSTGAHLWVDCSAESPAGRTGFCYDRAALDSRREHKPKNSVVEVATAMGVELLNEEQYRALQQLGPFDTRSSSWLQTPAEIRQLGGALFGDRRFGRVFVYHNGAQSYYSGRGFRGLLRV